MKVIVFFFFLELVGLLVCLQENYLINSRLVCSIKCTFIYEQFELYFAFLLLFERALVGGIY